MKQCFPIRHKPAFDDEALAPGQLLKVTMNKDLTCDCHDVSDSDYMPFYSETSHLAFVTHVSDTELTLLIVDAVGFAHDLTISLNDVLDNSVVLEKVN